MQLLLQKVILPIIYFSLKKESFSKEAIQKDLNIGAIGYSLIPDSFFDAFVNLYHKRYQTTLTKEEMVYVSGVVASIDSMIKLLTKEGDNIVMLSPIYSAKLHPQVCITAYGTAIKYEQW